MQLKMIGQAVHDSGRQVIGHNFVLNINSFYLLRYLQSNSYITNGRMLKDTKPCHATANHVKCEQSTIANHNYF